MSNTAEFVGLNEFRHEVGTCGSTFLVPGNDYFRCCGDPRCVDLVDTEIDRIDEALRDMNHHCGECGRNDWIQRLRTDLVVIFDCDECGSNSMVVPLSKLV